MSAGKVPVFFAAIAAIILVASSMSAESLRDVQSLESPARVAVVPGGHLLVSDYTAQRVLTLASSGLKIIRSFEVEGYPLSVAWADGTVLVGNESSRSIEAYNPAGKKLYEFSGAGEILPSDIAVDEGRGLVMVVDTLAGDVKVFSLGGSYLYPLTHPDDLDAPTALVLDPVEGLVYVSDYGSFSDSLFRRPKPFVRVFDYEGSSVTSFSGYFVRPQGLALDQMGRLYVAESLEGRIEVFEGLTGKHLTTLRGELSLPLDLAFDTERSVLYVSSNRNGRIVTFELEGGAQ